MLLNLFNQWLQLCTLLSKVHRTFMDNKGVFSLVRTHAEMTEMLLVNKKK
jgi:hypothetical protein